MPLPFSSLPTKSQSIWSGVDRNSGVLRLYPQLKRSSSAAVGESSLGLNPPCIDEIFVSLDRNISAT